MVAASAAIAPAASDRRVAARAFQTFMLVK
jgi:hypothetical protein